MHVISAFEDRASAERAIDRLVAAGFASDKVHLHDDAGRTQGDFAKDRDRGVLSSVGHFLASIFGQDVPERDAAHFSEAARRGHPIVAVDARHSELAERAADIMHREGAMNMDERAAQWRASGWSGG